MNLQEFIRLVALLVERETITAEEALLLVAMYEAGDVDPIQLPLPAVAAVEPDPEQDDITLLALWLGSAAGIAQRQRRRDVLRSAYESRLDLAADKLHRGQPLLDWHSGLITDVSTYTRAEALVGFGDPLDRYMEAQVGTGTRNDLRWLYMFAGAAASRLLLGRAYTNPYLRSRSRHYLARGWEMFFRGIERVITGVDGWVIDYISRDDFRVCSPCRVAEGNGPYLPGTGPYPGDVCEGNGYCRCERRRRWAPLEALELLELRQGASLFQRT